MFSGGALVEQCDLLPWRCGVTFGEVHRCGKIITAFKATDSRAEASVYALRRRVSSLTKEAPALPEGTLNRLRFQCTTSA